MLDKFAEELREARLSANMTLQQMAAKTRIDPKFLEALDSGDFFFLPELYVKAFIKEYADAVGVDVDQTIKKYELAKQGLDFNSTGMSKKEEHAALKEEIKKETVKSKPVQSFDGVQKPEGPTDKEKQSRQKNIFILTIVGGCVLVLLLLYLFVFKSSDEIIIPEKSFDEVVESDSPRYEEDTPTGLMLDSSGNPVVSKDTLALQIITIDTSWVKIIFDDSRAEDFILFPNSQKILIARNNFKITLGNAGGIQFKLNNEMLNFAGKAKTVMHVMIDSEGLKILTTPPVLE
jgi:transcriptional regulator with XRE-family HTH domain